MTEVADCIVIGAGVVGLAIARSLALSKRDVLLLEAEDRVGAHTSSRNSEVIHAGIYYPRDSLKATLCVAGRQALYRYCREKGVPHRQLGKLIVANGESEIEELRGILARGQGNGVVDLAWCGRHQVHELEPEIKADAAVYSPSTGIIDSHSLMLALQADLESAGGTVLLNHRVTGLTARDQRLTVEFQAGERFAIDSRTVVNSTGLWASSLASRVAGMETGAVPNTTYAKGHYFDYGPSPFQHLIYPLPGTGGLGIHATNDLFGRVRFGPDAEWVKDIDYAFDMSRREVFADAVTRYFPSLDSSRLVPGYTGIRPKLYSAGDPAADFVIQGPRNHGISGLVNLFGIESPGLTSCLAIADTVTEVVRAG